MKCALGRPADALPANAAASLKTIAVVQALHHLRLEPAQLRSPAQGGHVGVQTVTCDSEWKTLKGHSRALLAGECK